MAVFFVIFHGQLQRLCKTNNAIMILRTRTHIALLPAAVDKGFYLDIVVDIKKTSSLWSMKLMAGGRNKMNGYFSQINRIMSYCLHAIRMKNCIVLIAKLTHCFYR